MENDRATKRNGEWNWLPRPFAFKGRRCRSSQDIPSSKCFTFYRSRLASVASQSMLKLKDGLPNGDNVANEIQL